MKTRFLFLLLAACTAPAQALEIFVSILPQQTFARLVSGPEHAVHVLVGPGKSPATYELTARQLAQLAHADLYWRIGVPFETRWLPRLRRLNPGMRILDAREGIPLLDVAHDSGHGGLHADPHIWMDPNRVILMTEKLADTLAKIDPAQAASFRSRAARLADRLHRLDARIRQRLECLTHRAFLAYHPAWSYFADAYGLQQLVIEKEGKRPGPRRLARLIDLARNRGIRLILAQTQFSDADARAVAEATGAVLVRLDPLAADYFGMMETLVETLREHLGCRSASSASKT